MAFDLEITIAGLCVLARDHGPPGRLHVLMPTTGAHIHHARLGYSPEYVDGSSSAPPIFHRLDKMDLDLTGLSSSNGLDLALPAEVFDLNQVGGENRSVSRSLTQGPLPATTLFSRVSFAFGEYLTHTPGGTWFYEAPDGSERSYRMATEVRWVLENVPGADLPLDLGTAGKHTLTPIPRPSGKHGIRLMLLHLMGDELARIKSDTLPGPTKIPADREPADHFEDFYKLLTPRTPETLPAFDRTIYERQGGHTVLAPAAAGGSELTCMLTTAPVGP